jgi:hypothetical protein
MKPPKIEQDGFRFATPDEAGWNAMSILRFDTPDRAANIFVTTERLPAGLAFETYCAKKLVGVAKVKGFQLVDSAQNSGPLRGVRQHFRWESAEGPMQQIIVWLASAERLLTLSLTFQDSADAGRKSAWTASFNEMVASAEQAHEQKPVATAPSPAAGAAPPVAWGDNPSPPMPMPWLSPGERRR